MGGRACSVVFPLLLQAFSAVAAAGAAPPGVSEQVGPGSPAPTAPAAAPRSETASLSRDQLVALARIYVEREAAALGLADDDVADLRWSDASTNARNGVTHVRFVQRHRGLDVANGTVEVNLRSDGRLVGLHCRCATGLDPSPSAPSPSGVRPALTSAEAARAALDALSRFESRGDGEARRVGRVRGDARLVYQAGEAGALVHQAGEADALVDHAGEAGELALAWDVDVEDGEVALSVRVDAGSGEILDIAPRSGRMRAEGELATAPPPEPVVVVRDGSATTSGPAYRVFPPPTESPLHPIGVGTPQSLIGPLDDPIASPFGWHDTNGAPGAEHTETIGNNVDAYADADNAGAPSSPRPNGGVALVFDDAYDPGQAPNGTAANTRAAITNLFFWANHLHDVLYGFGFDEAAGNFQLANYGRGGVGLDRVRVEGQNAAATSGCNATYLSTVDGALPRIEIGLCNGRDGAYDHSVLAWAYGNLVIDRLTGGPSTVACQDNAESQRVGFADWLGLVLTQRSTHQGASRRPVGVYYFNLDPNGHGIRHRAYSASFAINESTYDSIKSLSIPTGVGTVWGTMLWDLTLALAGDPIFPGLPVGMNAAGGGSGFQPDLFVPAESPAAGGNTLALQLVIDAAKLQPCSPGFVDARNAILLADELTTAWADGVVSTPDGRNACTLWTVFARRGLGFSATQGSSNSAQDGSQAFDLPSSPAYVLNDLTISTAEAFRGQSIAATNLSVLSGGHLTLQSKSGVRLGNGFRVDPGGGLRVVIDPDHC